MSSARGHNTHIGQRLRGVASLAVHPVAQTFIHPSLIDFAFPPDCIVGKWEVCRIGIPKGNRGSFTALRSVQADTAFGDGNVVNSRLRSDCRDARRLPERKCVGGIFGTATAYVS